MSQPERILHIILICMRCLSVCNCSWSSIFRMKKSSSTEIRIKIRSFPRLLPQFFSYVAWFFFKSFSKDTEQPHCAESWPSCQAFCWSSLDYHLFTPPQIPCALGSFGLGLNSKWEGTDASLWELSSLVILGVELAELPEPYKVVALQNSLIKLYSHINWSKIFTSDQEVLYFFMGKQAQCLSREFYGPLKVI